MANKRISELVPITAPQLDFADLLLLSDISAHESKKLQLGDLSNFLLPDGRLTGSLLGTASYAMNAATASYAPFISASYAKTSSWAYNISTASYALAALSASYSYSSSYCITASYALTSSVELVYSSAFAEYAQTASYLLLTPGMPNGTASYALTASSVMNINNINIRSGYDTRITASGAAQLVSLGDFVTIKGDGGIILDVGLDGDSIYIATPNVLRMGNTIAIDANATASHAKYADAVNLVDTASFLAFNGIPNGTASYALSAGGILNVIQDYGMYSAVSQSISSSQLDMMTVTPTFGGLKTTTIEAFGTVVVPFTSSVSATDGDISLVVVNRQYGNSQSLDSSPVYAWIGGSTAMSGTLRYPFTLCGDAELNGQYEVYVTASNGVYLEGTRRMRFKVTSESDQLSVVTAVPMKFYTYAENAILLYSSSLHPGVAYQGSASQVTFSGSIDVTELLVPPNTVNIMNYTWTLMGLRKLTVDSNAGLTYFGGLPTGCISASAANCSLTELPPTLPSSSIAYLNVPNNMIVANLLLPQSMSYLDVSNNFYVSLPINMPESMSVLKADGTGITYTPFFVPNSLISMSFARCPLLSSWLSPLFPSSLKYLDVSNSPLNNIPFSMPASLLFVNVASSLLAPGTVGNIAAGLVANGLSNGSFAFLNTPASESAFNIIPNITTLRGLGWTIVS